MENDNKEKENTENNKSALNSKKKTMISFFAFSVIAAFIIGIAVIQYKRVKIPRGVKAPIINEYKLEEDFVETFGATVNDAIKIFNKNISTSYNHDETLSLIFKSFINFEYRYLYAYPFYCEKKGVDLTFFTEKFKKINSDISKKVTEISDFNNKISDYKESIYNSPALKEFLYNSIETEFKEIINNNTLKPLDLCETFNSPLQKEESFTYKLFFPKNADYILKYRLNSD